MNNIVTLETDMQLFTAALSQRKVIVIQKTNKVTLLYPGIVEKYDADTVQISGKHYRRSECSIQIV